jgi:hypothetical protein
MSISLEDYVSAGYLLTQYVDSAPYNDWMRTVCRVAEDLLPNRFLSVGLCSALRAPIFDWTAPPKEDYINFGIPLDQVPQLSTWADERLDKEIGHPNIFFHLATAREYIARFTNDASNLQLVGMGLHQSHLDTLAIIEQINPRRIGETGATIGGFESTGFARAVKLAQHLVPGEALGFDVICLRYGIEHSWLCTCFAASALQQFGFRPNSFGLIDEKQNADELATYANEGSPEEGVWLPVFIIRYPLHTA